MMGEPGVLPFDRNREKTKNNFQEKESKTEDLNLKLREVRLRIEEACAETKKSLEYENLRNFVDYIKGISEVFVEIEIKKLGPLESRNIIIETEMDLLSKESGLDRKVFESIYEKFKANFEKNEERENSPEDIGASEKTSGIVASLIEENKGHKECCEFVYYLNYVFSKFKSGMSKENLRELRNGLIRAKMQVLAYDGDPEMKQLEKIYEKFEKLLNDGQGRQKEEYSMAA